MKKLLLVLVLLGGCTSGGYDRRLYLGDEKLIIGAHDETRFHCNGAVMQCVIRGPEKVCACEHIGF